MAKWEMGKKREGKLSGGNAGPFIDLRRHEGTWAMRVTDRARYLEVCDEVYEFSK